MRLNFYTVAELESIVRRSARVIGLELAEDGANEIAKRSRGTPRIAGRLLRRVRDFAVVEGVRSVTRAVADGALGLRTNGFGFNLAGVAGQNVVVESSTDLVNWTALSTNTLGNGPLYFSDPASGNFPQRFYRARLQ